MNVFDCVSYEVQACDFWDGNQHTERRGGTSETCRSDRRCHLTVFFSPSISTRASTHQLLARTSSGLDSLLRSSYCRQARFNHRSEDLSLPFGDSNNHSPPWLTDPPRTSWWKSSSRSNRHKRTTKYVLVLYIAAWAEVRLMTTMMVLTCLLVTTTV